MDAKKEIHVVHTTHPLNQELFRMMATPREVSKAIKNTSQTQCTTCSTTRPKLQTCKQCKSVWYCSKECQKKDWTRHKAWCTPSDRPKGTRKLVETFVCNVTLVTMLQVCAALDLNLVNDKKKEIGFKVPFMIRVDIAIEPSDVYSFVKLFLTDEPISDKMEGMLQINRFHSHIPGRSGHIPLTQMRDTMWSGEREKLNGNPVHGNNPLGLVEFVNNDSDFSITCPLPIPPGPMKLARGKEPFTMLSGLTGGSFEKPMTVASCMEFMNLHIRADKENQLKLRVEMTEEDKLIVRNARDRSVKREAAIVLRQKMERESIYASMPLDGF
ncbi:hypothetical protein EV363DRAFT_1365132 [Boletus edulis]|nr:hypothetical protein EV363DRAFT_1365132 [Boletus edulis]